MNFIKRFIEWFRSNRTESVDETRFVSTDDSLVEVVDDCDEIEDEDECHEFLEGPSDYPEYYDGPLFPDSDKESDREKIRTDYIELLTDDENPESAVSHNINYYNSLFSRLLSDAVKSGYLYEGAIVRNFIQNNKPIEKDLPKLYNIGITKQILEFVKKFTRYEIKNKSPELEAYIGDVLNYMRTHK